MPVPGSPRAQGAIPQRERLQGAAGQAGTGQEALHLPVDPGRGWCGAGSLLFHGQNPLSKTCVSMKTGIKTIQWIDTPKLNSCLRSS